MRSLSLCTLLIVACLLPLCTSAQVFSGERARKEFPGVISVRLADNNPVPQYVHFSSQQRMQAQNVFHWLHKNTRLDNRTSFELLSTERDQLGMKHHRYQQFFEGIPVQGGMIILHEKDGYITSFNGELFALDASSKRGVINPQEIVGKALHYYPADLYAWDVGVAHRSGPLAQRPDPKLVWVSRNLSFATRDYRLAYEMNIYAVRPHLHRTIWLDAVTGVELAGQERNCHTDTPGTAQTQFSGERSVTTFENASGVFESRETGRGNGIRTYNTNFTGDYDSAYLFTDDDNNWEVNDGSDEGMECHWATEAFYDLLQDEFGRNSLDDAGWELISYVRFAPDFGNAFWNSEFATFGSGATGSNLDQSLASVEVTSHEFAHGLTEFTAGLIYNDESGALNESFSDIFGLYLDFKLRPEVANWIMGEESTSSGEGIRSASNPNYHGDPDCYDGDLWVDGAGVHTNSGVQNHWYYLLSEGGSGINDLGDAYDIAGVGVDVAAQIAYRNLVVYLTPSSNYADAAFYAQLATTDLYGRCSDTWASNANAWHAVGLGTPVSTELEASFTAQQVHCEVPATVNFINTSSFSETATWDFGDGNTSTEYSPTHTYTSAGTYDVSLVATGCDMGEDMILREQFILVDPEADACDTIVMAPSGANTLEACSGIVLDPGGDGPYGNGTYTVLTVVSPSDEPYIIDVLFAEIEQGFDDLYIYDGPNEGAPLLAVITGTPGPSSYTTSGGVFTLAFSTDGSVVREGFVVQFSSENGGLVPTAGFSTSASDILLSEPMQITSEAVNAGTIWYDMGDGNTIFEESHEYRYTTPGTYTITQYASSCADIDTAYQEVVVAEGGSLTLTPDTICITLVSGNSLDTMVSLANGGPGQLYYEWDDPTAGWANMTNTVGIIEAGQMAETGINITTDGLLEGEYTQEIVLFAGDETSLVSDLVLKLTVIGIPEIVTTPNPNNFGEVFNTLTYEQEFLIENNGTGTLEVESWSNGNSGYSFSIASSFEIPAQSSATVTVTLSPSGLGDLSDVLVFQTNAGTHEHQLLANSVPAPIVSVDPDSLCITLAVGQSTTEAITISNTGGSELMYEWGTTGSILVWMHGVDQVQEGQAILDILGSYLPDVEVTVYDGTDAAELGALLAEARVLIMPESEFGNSIVYQQAAPGIQSFVSNGGGLIHVYGGDGDPIGNVGIFAGFVGPGSAGEPLIIQDADHPLLDNVSGPLNALNYTLSWNFTSPDRTDILGMFAEENSVLSVQEYGSGKAAFIGFDYFEVSGYAEQILANAVDWVASSAVGGLPPWLTIDPSSGTVEAGGDAESSFLFDATGLEAGTYMTNAILVSNDPATPTVAVDVKLIVVAVPEASFFADPLTSCDGIINFTDGSQNTPTSWTWDFGDGNTSDEQNPTHEYTVSGIYDVSLTACNDLGCDEDSRLAYIQIDLEGGFCDTLVMQDDTPAKVNSCTGYIVDNGGVDGDYTNNFASTVFLTPPVAESISLYVEDFLLEGCCDFVRIYDGNSTTSPLIGSYNGTDLVPGDVITSTGNAMTIVFTTDGSVVRRGFIFRYECNGTSPIADFSYDTDMDCENTVNFNNQSQFGDNYTWDFGDGTSSQEANPTHHFSTAGPHDVRLTVENDFGQNAHEETVTINSVPFDLDIDMPSQANTNSLVTFSPASSASLVEFLWELGPGNYTDVEDALFVYLNPGTYPITLTATDANGCSVTVTREIEVTVINSVDGLQEGEHLVFYPNPTADELTIDLELQENMDLSFVLYNSLGQVIRKYPLGQVNSFRGNIDLSNVPAGSYYLQLLTSDGRMIVGKVQKL